MQKNKLYIVLVLSALVISSCEKIVKDVDAPDIEQQLVLYSFISPEESTTQVELTLSEPIFTGKEYNGHITHVNDANVVLKDNAGNSVTLIYVDSLEQYAVNASQFPIVPGQTYHITATGRGKSVSASCTIPLDRVEITMTKYQKTGDLSTGYEGPFYRYSYEWKDVPGKANYYLASTMHSENYETVQDTQYYYVCEGLPVSDYNRDGETIKGLCEDYNFGPLQNGNVNFNIAFFLLNTDIHYYEYHRRRIPYEEGNPFSEPYEQYSNVNGGLGVFCSYRKSKTVISVKE